MRNKLRAPRSDGFPDDFVWGAATAAYQIEGSTTADGRGESVWDRFCRTPGKVYGGMTGDLACDSYRRWREDVALLRQLGVDSYRFSIAWPRIQSDGKGQALQAGIDHYRRLADALIEEGIEPAVTIYHWDHPQALEDAGGWPARDMAFRFAEFADIVFRSLGDRVGRWITLNEPWCSSILAWDIGLHAPGRKDKAAAYRAVHHHLLGHALAMEAAKAAGISAPVGISLNLSTPRPATRREEDVRAAGRASAQQTELWLDPLFGRPYPQDHLAAYPELRMPVEAGDMERIARGFDFLGINYYSEQVVEAAPAVKACPEGYRLAQSWCEKTEMGWDIVPEGLERQLKAVAARWPCRSIIVTENGRASRDLADSAGRISDQDRIAYLKAHLAACRRAIEAGVPLHGYYHWSLLDNFEWSWGYSKRFGLVHVDFGSGERRPKDSFWYYRDCIAGYEP